MVRKKENLFLAVWAVFVLAIECVPDCRFKNANGMLSDPNDCSTFYWCFADKPVKYTCTTGEVWNADKMLCVPKNSNDDLCTKKDKTMVANQPLCASGVATMMPHSEKCSKYYECVNNGLINPEVKECPYPKLFDDEYKICDYPERVKCKNRTEPKGPCDYDVNKCTKSIQCVPCHERFPSCNGKSDGLHAWEGREWTPVYVICKNERVLYTDECQGVKDKPQIFDPHKQKCIEQIIITVPTYSTH